MPASTVRAVSSATERPVESLWPPAAALREAALVLAGLVLIVLLADGRLVLWLSAVLVVAWAVLSFRRAADDAEEPPMWARLVPLFAIAGLLFALTRTGRVLQERRSA